MVPVIETDRLRLRAHRQDDFAACAAMWAVPEVVRYIGGKPFTVEEVWARVLRYAGHWQWRGCGFWAREEKSTGVFAGDLGFAEFKRDIDPSIQGIPEIGWVLAPHAQGKGYATEAVRAIVAWGDHHFDQPRTVCLIHPENQPSLRVAEKCGYQQFHRTTYHGQPTIILERQSSS
jgi:RimJ/RimL family protein N-acetyltransferase